MGMNVMHNGSMQLLFNNSDPAWGILSCLTFLLGVHF
jgi:hypothetical protein